MCNLTLGKFVTSKSGRDKGRVYVIVSFLESPFVVVCDGYFRRLDNPKKKNLKHLIVHPQVDSGLQQALTNGDKVNNSTIRKAVERFAQLLDHGREEGSTVHGER